MTDKHRGSIIGALLGGAAAGALGALAMNATQTAIRRSAEAFSGPQNEAERSEENEPKHRSGDNPTEQFYSRVAGPPETDSEKRAGGRAVHIGFGAAAGAFYGVTTALAPRLAVGRGLPFGAAVWLFANEMGLAAAGLTKPPAHYEAATHAFALVSHLVYGAVTDAGVRLGKQLPLHAG